MGLRCERFEVATRSQLHPRKQGLWSSVGGAAEDGEGRKRGMKGGRRAAAGLLVVPVALGSLRVPVLGMGSAQIPVVIISTSLAVATRDRKSLFIPCVCVCERECECLLLLLLTESVEEIGRKRSLKEKLDYPNRERGIGAGASCQSSSEGK